MHPPPPPPPPPHHPTTPPSSTTPAYEAFGIGTPTRSGGGAIAPMKDPFGSGFGPGSGFMRASGSAGLVGKLHPTNLNPALTAAAGTHTDQQQPAAPCTLDPALLLAAGSPSGLRAFPTLADEFLNVCGARLTADATRAEVSVCMHACMHACACTHARMGMRRRASRHAELTC